MCVMKKPPGKGDALSLLATAYSATAAQPLDNLPLAESAPSLRRGSARRRLWDLSPGAACPVTGVCLCFPDLKRLARRAGLHDPGPTEYGWHIAVVAECRRRSPMAELINRELDKRFDLCVKRSMRLKDDEALASWWDQSCMGTDWAGVFWAVLTHPRCTPELEYVILGQVHMLQHQVGMAARVDQTRLDALLAQNRQLGDGLALAQHKLVTAVREAALRQERLEADSLCLRAELIREKTAHAQTRLQLDAWQQQMPDLPSRQQLVQANQALADENRQLRRIRVQAAPLATATWPPELAERAKQPPCKEPADPCSFTAIEDKAVLCVGGRQRGVPVYRSVVENRGARFLHHDGGHEDKAGQLGAMLQTADLVICQVGCISHNAYWRVKEHCKRHDKPCLFVETTSRAAIENALQSLRNSPAQCAPAPAKSE